jgi:PAS domain S-box-containing protein
MCLPGGRWRSGVAQPFPTIDPNLTPSPEPAHHSFTLCADLSETSRARQLVLPLAVDAGFSGERCFDIQVAASEACANAIEHSPPDSPVELEVLAYGDRLEVQVEGRGRFELPAVAARERAHRGLGLPLMAKLSDHLALYSGPRGGTRIALTFYRPGFKDGNADSVTPPTIAELLAENQLVSAIMASFTDEVWFADPQKRFTLINEVALGEFHLAASEGVGVEELVERSEIYRADMSPRPVDEAPPLRALAGEVVRNEEEVVRTPATGELQHRLVSAAPVRDLSGTVIGAVSTVRDITERKLAQTRAEESEERLRQVMDSIQDDFYVLDRDWNFVYASRLFAARIGKEPEDFVGRNIWEMFPDHLGTMIEENFRATMRQREVRRFVMPGKNGDAWYGMACFPSSEGITVLGTDITERERAEAALRATNEELERFNRAMVGRELRMVELKQEVNRLCRRCGEAPRYAEVEDPDRH